MVEKKHNEYQTLREEVWSTLSSIVPKPPMATIKRIAKAKIILWDDENFWWDILDRHGLRNDSFDNLEKDVKEHVVGNFWGQVCQCIVEKIIGGKK